MAIIKGNCRLCQKELGVVPLEGVLTEAVFEISRIKINDTDYNTFLPTSICTECNRKILEIQLFITEIQNVDRCLKSFLDQKYLDSSIKNIDSNNKELEENSKPKTVCLICSKIYRRLSSLKKHQKNHPELYCANCDICFESVNLRTNHKCKRKKVKKNIKQHGEDDGNQMDLDQKVQCGKCEDYFENETIYRTHLKVHNLFSCSEENCFKVYSSSSSLNTHKLNHEGKRSFLCVTCGKCFISRKSLSCHEKIHAPVKAHKCDSCNISFSVRSNFRAHIKRYHEGLRYHCSQCPKEFFTKCNLDRHEKLHTGIREFQCEKCASAFYTKKELMKHQIYHQGLKQHKCEQCFKTFFERHHLIIHLRTHTGERPYVCKIPGCGKSFYDSQKLKRHRKSNHISK